MPISLFANPRHRLNRPLKTVLLGVSSFLLLGCLQAMAQEEQPLPPEAERQEGVPEGKIEGPFELRSEIYPGTERKFWIYVPDQYDAEKPACSMIVQDGLSRARDWNLPTILDNLIHNNEVPVTIGIFVEPGVVPPLKEDAQPRFNRSFEYDSLGDRYARFLLEELLPEVGEHYNLSNDPNDRLLAGASSGGICAFNAAWERPDSFRRVLSTIGTFVGLRGADEFPTLIRKSEPKPIRIFLQDGSQDLNIYAGDWWVANQDMLSALTWSGYEVNHQWGEGGHNGNHAAAIMPQALRWLWHDYPQPIEAGKRGPATRRTDILSPGERWQRVSSGHEMIEAATCNAEGQLFFCDSRAGRIYRIGEDKKTRIFTEQSGRVSSLAFAPDGKLYAACNGELVVRFTVEGKEERVLEGLQAGRLVTLPDGFYVSDSAKPSILWSDYDGQAVEALSLSDPPSTIAPTIDHSFLHIATNHAQYTLHARIAANWRLGERQRYGYLHKPYLQASSGVTASACDEQGRLYLASSVGVQVLDQLGRVHLILEKPSESAITGLAFGGSDGSTLYVTTSGSVFARKLKTRGVPSFVAPQNPPRPNL